MAYDLTKRYDQWDLEQSYYRGKLHGAISGVLVTALLAILVLSI